MKFIGITGGVGAGKTQILSYLATKPGVRVMLADEIAHELMEPGTSCYEKLRECFGAEDVFLSDGQFDRAKLAATIFAEEEKRAKLNAIVHPAVKEYVRQQAKLERERKNLRLLVLEAALLIDEHYDKICDELWYIDTDREIRRARLKASRGYSDEKVDRIFASQLSDAEYRNACAVRIENNGAVENTFAQIDESLRRVTDE
jgi:dephospho-CoA kinase